MYSQGWLWVGGGKEARTERVASYQDGSSLGRDFNAFSCPTFVDYS